MRNAQIFSHIEEAVNHIRFCNRSRLNFLIYEEKCIYFFQCGQWFHIIRKVEGNVYIVVEVPGYNVPGDRIGEGGGEE
jgi:hypothetical protein